MDNGAPDINNVADSQVRNFMLCKSMKKSVLSCNGDISYCNKTGLIFSMYFTSSRKQSQFSKRMFSNKEDGDAPGSSFPQLHFRLCFVIL
jgi:hypothetical protein